MSRPDGQNPQHGNRPAPSGVAGQDPQTWGYAQQPARPQAQQPAPQQGHYDQHADPYGQQGQGYYYAPQPQQPAARAPQQAQPAYAPQFDPYQRAAAPAPQQAAYGQQQNYAPQQAPQAAPTYAPAPAQSYAPANAQPAQPALRGATYDQWARAETQHDPRQQQADPRSYDLASYMPPANRPQTDYTAPQAANSGYSDWGHANSGYAQQPQDAAHAQGYDHSQQYAEGDGYAEDDAGGEYEQAPRRSKMMLLAATLVGAIVIGGGLTYGYQALTGGSDGPTPVIKSATGPTKVKPSDPGGKQFAHSDSKLLGRLGDGGSSADTDTSGAKKVSTLVVGRDGTIQPPSAPAVSVPVPGMTIVDITGAPSADTAAPQKADAQSAPPASSPSADAAAKLASGPLIVAPPQKPIVVAKAEPTPPPTTTQALADTAAGDAAPVKPTKITKAAPVEAAVDLAPEKPAKAQTAALDTTAKPAKVKGPAPTGAGYVAVLASVPASKSSRLDALQQFADMQQRYSAALQSKTPDVQEANLGEKGTYHRLIVGPPGSRESASGLCSQLKTQGYGDCWVMAY